ncbi:MAG: T9SS type A sorting domain-containing protein [Bacteroidales bacterium]|nr:T9SS type A sorting domain-containing protein [Bacteroidales bacterium]
MKKLFTLFALTVFVVGIYAQTQVTVTLDTKKFINIDCSLGADGAGGPSTLPKVYMHSGLCTTGDIYCKTQIIPLNSLVWEHVVGNWGDNPQDDGVGEMVTGSNGVYTKTIIIEDYYSGSWVSTEWNETNTVQSTPMDPGATPYTIGLVFRNPDGTITGRDNMCNDIFVTDINTTNPKVIQSFDLLPWANSPVTIEREIIGINEMYNINFFKVLPNPVRDDLHIEFYLKTASQTQVVIMDAFGKLVTAFPEARLNEGKHVIKADIFNLNLAQGIYYVSVKTEYSVRTEKIVVIR